MTGVVAGLSRTAMRGRVVAGFASVDACALRSTILMQRRDGVVGSVGTADRRVNEDMGRVDVKLMSAHRHEAMLPC